MPARDLYAAVEGLSALLRKHEHPLPSDRLSRHESRLSIERLPELQVVIETLLARISSPEAATGSVPPHFIPRHSLPEDWAKGRLCGEERLWTWTAEHAAGSRPAAT